MTTACARVRLLAIAAALTLLSSSCWAQGGLVPNGDPTGDAGAIPKGGALGATLDPNPALLAEPEQSDWLLPALEAQGYKEKNISYSTTLGFYSIDDYFAFADRTPDINNYGFDQAGRPVPHKAGAAIDIDYQPEGLDPSGSDVHWISVIYTNAPDGRGKRRGANLGGGFYAYIDDLHNPASNPYYDLRGTANSEGFIDNPARTPAPGLVWEAQTFTVTGDLTGSTATTTLDIEDGVQWGFADISAASIPEPSTLVLAGTAAVIGLGLWARRRRWARTARREAARPEVEAV